MPKTADSVRAYWQAQLDLMHELPEQVRLRDPDAIHDLRAAGRRTKSTVRTYRPLLRRELAHEVLTELDWYNAQLGVARDAEVIHDEVAQLLDDHPQAREIESRLAAEKERTALIADQMLLSQRAAGVVELVQQLVDDPWSRRYGAAPGRKWVLRRVLWAERRVVQMWQDGPTADEDSQHWGHRLRRRAKSARYAAESVIAADKSAAQMAAGYAQLSTVLGVIQDCSIIKQTLSTMPPEVVAEAIHTWEARATRALGQLEEAIAVALPPGAV